MAVMAYSTEGSPMQKFAMAILAVLIAATLVVWLHACSAGQAEAKVRADWQSRADQAGCFVTEERDPARPSALRQLIAEVTDTPAQEPRFRVFVPNERTAERILPMLAERNDILLIDYHVEDVSAWVVGRMRALTPKTIFQVYNPPATWPDKMGRHVEGKDWNGVLIADGDTPPQ